MKYLFCVSFLLIVLNAKAQQDAYDIVPNTLEKYLENTETYADYTQVVEDMSSFLNNPINLNSVTLEELQNFPLLSPVEAVKIIAHRQKYGPFLDIAELQVCGITVETIKRITPYISLQPSVKQQWKNIRNNILHGTGYAATTAKRKMDGTNSSNYLGNLWSQNLRVQYSKQGMYGFGMTADKDAGEKYWRKGPDFISAHASLSNMGIIKTAVIGDYLLSFGQGLVMGSGIGIGKSANVLNIKRIAPNLKPYRGTNEFFFLRGGAVSFAVRNWTLTTAVSSNKLDAHLNDTNSSSEINYSSVDVDGLHRTASEIAAKGNIRRYFAGAWLQKQGKLGQWGLGANCTQYNHPLNPTQDLYKLYYPNGRTRTFLHAFQAHTLGNIHLFSEWALSATNMRTAMVGGMLVSLGKNAELSTLFRNYQSGFTSDFSTAFGNSSQNEQGLYSGLLVHFTRNISLSSFVDVWKNPWLGYNLYAPARGTDILLQLDYTPNKNSQFYVRVRNSCKPLGTSTPGPMRTVQENTIHSVRLHLTTSIGQIAELQMRGESNISQNNNVLYQTALAFVQVGRKIRSTKTRISARYTLFNVPFYYARVFASENQLQYDYGSVAYYGKGCSAYLMVNQRVNRKWNLGLRLSSSNNIVPGETTISKKQSIFVQLSRQI